MRLADRVLETTTTTGTSSYALAGAVAGHRTFLSGLGAGALTGYVVTDGTNWEVGYGTLSAGPATLTRAGILASSNAGAAVNWGVGSKYVYSAPIGVVLQSLLTMHKGSARPAWLTTGFWLNDTDANVWVWNYYDGGGDIPLVRIDKTNNRGIFEGAKGADIASATAIELGAATGGFVHVTGTTSIATLGTANAGVQRLVKFTGALVLQHDNAKIVLPGGANILTAAGDIALFVSQGANLWELAAGRRASGIPWGYAEPAAPTMKVVDLPGAFTVPVPTGARVAWVRYTGGGGGGGGTDNVFAIGCGGGAGGTVEHMIPLTGVSQLTGTIGAGGTAGSNSGGDGGAGGDTSLSGYYTAPGGGGGGGIPGADEDPGGIGGVPSVGSPDDGIVTSSGGSGSGGVGQNNGDVQFTGGHVGASYWGGGGGQGIRDTTSVAVAGSPGQAPGSGGGGGMSFNATGSAGGAGAAGILVIVWFY